MRIVPLIEACEPAQGACGPLYDTLLILLLHEIVNCLFVFPLEVPLFLFIPTFVSLARPFVRNKLDFRSPGAWEFPGSLSLGL